MYLVLEGIDTAGKSTQIELLQDLYENLIITKEPGATPLGEQIRDIVLHQEDLDSMTELLLFLSDRREHFAKRILPALKEHKTIISDRSFISGIAYALTNKSLDQQKLTQLNLMVLDNTLPDGVVLFKLSKETLTYRLSQKSHDGIEKRGIDYLLQVQDALITTTQDLGIKHIIVDASSKIELIHEQIKDFMQLLGVQK